MLSFKEYIAESKNLKTVVLAFGRMNPPTIGHKKLMEKIVSVAKKENADAKLYLSHSQDAERNPLSYEEKIKFAKLMGVKGLEVVSSPLRTIYQVVAEQGKDGYKRVIVICGSDRLEAFKSLKKYTKEWNLDLIELVSAGNRNDNSNGVSGASATKLRKAVKEGDKETFNAIAGVEQKYKDELWNAIRKDMNLD